MSAPEEQILAYSYKLPCALPSSSVNAAENFPTGVKD